MVQRESYADIEVRADAMNLFIAAFDVFPSIAQKYLHRKGLVTVDAYGKLKASSSYIPLELWLDTFDEVQSEIGPNALFRIGQHGVKNPNFPVTVHDLEGALRQIDLAYHLSHRKGGAPMLDKATGRMVEGIGHYAVERAAGEKKIVVRCDTPYPCSGELGLVSGVVALFEPRGVVTHGSEQQCRMKGGNRCTYVVSW